MKTRYVLDADGEPVANETVGTGGRGWYVEDPRGNVSQHVGGAGAVKGVFAYDPFGKEKPALTSKAAGWDSRLRFQAAPRDPKTGMYSLGPRLLDPAINRFVGADHYVAAAANMELALDPMTGNRYLYAGANPANLIDDGHAPKCKGWRCWGRRIAKGAAIVGGVAGAVACGASVVCGVAVGVAAGAASYAASNAGTKSFRWSGLATEGAVGGVLGRIGVAGLGKAAASRALASNHRLPGNYLWRAHFDRKVHKIGPFGLRPHWQINLWRSGSKGSGLDFRFPVWRSF